MSNALLEETATLRLARERQYADGRTRRPMRILVAHNVPRARNGGMSRIMGFIHDHVEAAGHEVEYLTSEDVSTRLGGRLSRFSFPVLVRRHAADAARAGRPFDVVNVHEPVSAVIAAPSRRASATRP